MAKTPTIRVLIIAAVNESAKKPYMPGFVALLVPVDHDEFVAAHHLDYAEELLTERGYGGPFVLFAEKECPRWLLTAFKRGDIKGVTPAAWRKAVVQRERLFAEQSG